MAVLVILVPASAPVGDHDFRLLFANGIAQTQGALLRERYFGIRVEQEDCLRPQQARCFLGGSALHFAVLFHWDVLRRTPLAPRKAQAKSFSSAPPPHHTRRQKCTPAPPRWLRRTPWGGGLGGGGKGFLLAFWWGERGAPKD